MSISDDDNPAFHKDYTMLDPAALLNEMEADVQMDDNIDVNPPSYTSNTVATAHLLIVVWWRILHEVSLFMILFVYNGMLLLSMKET